MVTALEKNTGADKKQYLAHTGLIAFFWLNEIDSFKLMEYRPLYVSQSIWPELFGLLVAPYCWQYGCVCAALSSCFHPLKKRDQGEGTARLLCKPACHPGLSTAKDKPWNDVYAGHTLKLLGHTLQGLDIFHCFACSLDVLPDGSHH